MMNDFSRQAAKFLTQLQAADGLDAPGAFRLLLPALVHNRNEAEATKLLAELQHSFSEEAWTAVREAIAASKLLILLTKLFDTLRRQTEWALGVGEFMLLLEALQTNYGMQAITDNDRLKELCQLLWAKSPIEKEVLAYFFYKVFELASLELPEELAEKDEENLDDKSHQGEKTQKQSKGEQDSQDAGDELEFTSKLESQDVGRETAEQMMVSAPSRTFGTQDRELAYQRFLLSIDYLPVTRRQLKQGWRYLRHQVRQGPLDEIDIPATVRRITEEGFFLTPVLQPRRTNKAAMLLLIDQNGSMAPFHLLSRRLEETVLSAGNLGQVQIYYFHDCPTAVRDNRITTDLYREHTVTRHPQGLYARTISEIVHEFDLTYTSVLIFSDGGAARSSWDENRIDATHLFLYQLRSLGVKNIIWLNPMPEDRWEGERLEALNLLEKFENSATAIAGLVPMVSMERDGLYRAIDGLKGKV